MNLRILSPALLVLASSGTAAAQVCLLADGFEPNDDCLSAQNVGTLCQPGLTVSLGDPDWYRILIPPQTQLRLGILVDDLTAGVELLGLIGCTPTQNLAAVLPARSVHVIDNPGTSSMEERIRIQVPSGAATVCTTYALDAQLLPLSTDPPCSALDPWEPNNCCEVAAPLVNASLSPQLRARAGDPDWYEFTVAADSAIDVYLEQLGGAGTFSLSLYDFCGALPLETGADFVSAVNTSGFPLTYWVEVQYSDAVNLCGTYDIGFASRPPLLPFCRPINTGCALCPCGNDPSPGQNGCLNSAGSSAQLVGSGAASVSGDTLRFEAHGLTPSTFSVLLSGARRAPTNPAHPCFGIADGGLLSPLYDGMRCIAQGILRHGGRPSDGSGDVGTTNNGWGPPSGPPGGLIANAGLAAGQTRHFQLVYRDFQALSCMTGLNTTNGVSVSILP